MLEEIGKYESDDSELFKLIWWKKVNDFSDTQN